VTNLGALAESWKATVSFVMSVSQAMYQRDWHWTYFLEIWWWQTFRKMSKILTWLKLGKTVGHFIRGPVRVLLVLLPATLIRHKCALFREMVSSCYDSRGGTNIKRTHHIVTSHVWCCYCNFNFNIFRRPEDDDYWLKHVAKCLYYIIKISCVDGNY